MAKECQIPKTDRPRAVAAMTHPLVLLGSYELSTTCAVAVTFAVIGRAKGCRKANLSNQRAFLGEHLKLGVKPMSFFGAMSRSSVPVERHDAALEPSVDLSTRILDFDHPADQYPSSNSEPKMLPCQRWEEGSYFRI